MYNSYYVIIHQSISLFFFIFSGTFALLQAYAFLIYMRTKVSWSDFKNIFVFAVVAVAGLVFVSVILLTYAGKLHFTIFVIILRACVYGRRVTWLALSK